ncbi:conjugal transfer protein [Clostridium porci]
MEKQQRSYYVDTIRTDIPTSSAVTDVIVWNIEQSGTDTFSATYEVDQQIKEGDQTNNDTTAFLETFFKLYSTATGKELAYYVSGNVLEPIGRNHVFSELVNPVFKANGDNVKVKVAVKFLDNQTKETQVSQYELVLHKDSNWKIVG